MQNIIVTLIVVFSSAFAFASAPVIPDYPQSDCSGPACASVARGKTIERINVEYAPQINGTSAIGSQVNMGALLNDNPVKVQSDLVAGGTIFHIDIPANAEGDLAVYFFNSHGEYDSNYGNNYHFTVK